MNLKTWVLLKLENGILLTCLKALIQFLLLQEDPPRIKNNFIKLNKYLLLTKFEVPTVSCGASFTPSVYGYKS